MRAVLAAALRRLAHQLEPRTPLDDALTHHLAVCASQGELVVQLDGEHIVRAIKKRNKRKGVDSAGI